MTLLPRLDRLVRIDPTRLRVLLVAAAAVVGFHVCAVAAGDPSWFVFALVLVATVGLAARTDGATEVVLLALLALEWWGATDRASWWSVPAATCLLALHSAVTLVASGPDSAPVPRALAVRWLRRTALVAGGCAVAGSLVLAVRSVALDGPCWPVPVVLVVLAAVTVVFSESVRRPER